MIDTLFEAHDKARRGADYLRKYNTGTLDTTGMTPRATLFRRSTWEAVGAVKMARIDGTNWALVVEWATTNSMTGQSYQINVDFEDPVSGRCIPHGIIYLGVLPGVPHP